MTGVQVTHDRTRNHDSGAGTQTLQKAKRHQSPDVIRQRAADATRRKQRVLRPTMSETGPYTSWPAPIAMKKAIRLAWTCAVVAPRLRPMAGKAGKYISVANGPTAESSPRTRATRKKE